MLSIVIPTYNEEKRLPILLEALLSEKIPDLEIIVADRRGKDKTREVAEKYGCLITDGGTPAEGRNNGAKIAKGDIILFLDADVKISPDFLKKSLSDFEKNNLGVASYHIYPIKSNLFLNKFILNVCYNWHQKTLRKIFPMGAMGIMVRKDIFNQVGGFDPKIKLAEDIYFVQQAAKLGGFDIIKGTPLYMPTRRFDKDGYFRTGGKYLLCGLHMVFLGPVKSGRIFDYKFNHYDNNKK
ncbi:MAG: glycosyltransferase [Candidatus Paceibacterota bacterium]